MERLGSAPRSISANSPRGRLIRRALLRSFRSVASPFSGFDQAANKLPAWGEPILAASDPEVFRGELEKTIAKDFWLWLVVGVSQNNHVYQSDHQGSFVC